MSTQQIPVSVFKGRTWAITANGFDAALSFNYTGPGWVGTFDNDLLTEVSFHPNFRFLSFTRNMSDGGKQFYVGTVHAGARSAYGTANGIEVNMGYQLSGIFQQDTDPAKGTYFWCSEIVFD
jgi:hypothetical protein